MKKRIKKWLTLEAESDRIVRAAAETAASKTEKTKRKQTCPFCGYGKSVLK